MARLIFKNTMGRNEIPVQTKVLPGSVYDTHGAAAVLRLENGKTVYDVLLSSTDITRLLPFLTIGELPEKATGEEIRAFVKVARMMRDRRTS